MHLTEWGAKVILPIYFASLFCVHIVKYAKGWLSISERSLLVNHRPLVENFSTVFLKTMSLYFIGIFILLPFIDYSAHEYLLLEGDGNSLLMTLGIILLIFSSVVSNIAVQNLKNEFSTFLRHPKTLITTGIHARSRNPMLFAELFAVFGIFFVSMNPLLALVYFLSFIISIYRSYLEAVILENEFGDSYKKYREAVRFMFGRRNLGTRALETRSLEDEQEP
ncbi:hypothetical protein PCE1_004865 [Barthelona sp. PCE]